MGRKLLKSNSFAQNQQILPLELYLSPLIGIFEKFLGFQKQG